MALHETTDRTGVFFTEREAGVIHRENSAVVKIADELLPCTQPVVHLSGVFGRCLDVVGEDFRRAQREHEAGRKHRIHKTERVADHDPSGAVAALGDELIIRVARHFREPLTVYACCGKRGVACDGGF